MSIKALQLTLALCVSSKDFFMFEPVNSNINFINFTNNIE